ncbi:MAG: rod shape-determining protein RodA [Alphaproteobacteria bacterium]
MAFFSSSALPLGKKWGLLPWWLLLMITLVACFGFLLLYSAAGGNWTPWTLKQMIRFGFGATFMLGISLVDVRFWMGQAYFFYGACLVLLVCVEAMGFVGMGAQRWVDLYIFQLQPSELMKIALVLALARYFHGLGERNIPLLRNIWTPALLIAVPSLLVLRQPDLGTAGILILVGLVLCFAAGFRLWIFIAGGGACAAAFPILWSLLRDYQKKRIFIFLDPEQDPLGAGYHILQSKIALGSGGLWGKGFMAGTQSHLNFLPEKQTDFIFTMLGEEMGMMGCLALLALYASILILSYRITLRSRFIFTHLLALGVTSVFFFHAFINMAMVMGLLPVVGVPLPLMSYGGTSMLTLLIGFGFLFCVEIHHHTRISNPV